MKQGWEIKRLGDICDLQNGFAFKSNDYIEFSNTMNFRMSQIRPDGGIDLENNPKYLPDAYAVKYKDYLLKEGDVVIAMTDLATETKILGVPTIVPMDDRNWLLNQRVGKLFKIDFSKVDVTFLKYILTSETVNEYYKSLGRGGLQINIGKQDILNAKIPIPPLPEQQRIVAILDEAFAAIAKAKANAQQNLKNAKELFESYLQGVFENKRGGWEEKTLGDVCSLYQGIAINAKTKHALVEKSDLPLLRIKDLKNNTVEQYIDPNNYPVNALVNEEDIIYTRTGSLGLVFRGNRGVLHNNSFKVVPNSELTKDYLFIWLQNPIFKTKIMGLAMKAAQPDITHAIFKIQEISVPPLKEQNKIVKNLDALSSETKKLETIYQQKINDLEELKKSILQKAFSGELNNKTLTL